MLIIFSDIEFIFIGYIFVGGSYIGVMPALKESNVGL